MSTNPASNSANGHTPVRSAQATPHATRRTGSDAPPDLFSNLLTLVGSTHNEQGGALGAQDADRQAHGAAAHSLSQETDNPVHALLNWVDPTTHMPTKAPTHTTHLSAAQASLSAAVAPQNAASDDPASQGIALTGMTGLNTTAPLGAPTATVMAQARQEHAETRLSGTGTEANPAARAEALETATALAERMGSEGTRPAALGRPDTLQDARPAAKANLWRKTSTQTAATAVQEMGSLRAQASEATTVRFGAQTALMRSTVAMHERAGASAPFATVMAGEADAPPTAGLRPAGARPGEAPIVATGAAVSDLLDTEASPETRNANDGQLQEATADPQAEPEADQISHWSNLNLRHASLRVGQGGEDAIDIQLSMSGQEVRVDFRTDNAEARASLQQNAGESLADLLQRSGIQLGDVSVGAQGQRHDGAERRDAAPARLRQPEDTAAEPLASPAISRPRADGSQPLDVFA